MKLTTDDLDAIRDLFEVVFDEKTENFVKKSDINHLPTKDEFYEKMDELMKEVENGREEQTVLSGRVSNHEERLQVVEEKLQIAS